MRVLLYAGPAQGREALLQFSAPIIARVATQLTLISGGGAENRPFLDEAQARLAPPARLPVDLVVLPDEAGAAIVKAAGMWPYDLVLLGRLQRPLRRLIQGQRSKWIAQHLEPSVLRFDGEPRPLRRILMASSGGEYTLGEARLTARLALPLGAEVTLLYVRSQQSLLFTGDTRPLSDDEFLTGPSEEAQVLQAAARLLSLRGVNSAVKIRSGPVVDEILAELRAGEFDLLVAGAHRPTTLIDQFLLEDLTGDLLDLSPVPVLVARDG